MLLPPFWCWMHCHRSYVVKYFEAAGQI